MIQPAAVKYTCKCGFSRIYQPQSDALNPLHAQYACTCPKCGEMMSGEALPPKKRYGFTFSDGMPDEEALKKTLENYFRKLGQRNKNEQ